MSTPDFEVTGYDTGLIAHTPDQVAQWHAAADVVEAMNEGCGQRKPCASCDARKDAADALRNTARRLAADETPDGGPGCAHCGNRDHAWDDCEAYTKLVAADEPAAGARQSDDPDRIVAYRSRGGCLLRCLAHHPGREAIGSGDLRPVTADAPIGRASW